MRPTAQITSSYSMRFSVPLCSTISVFTPLAFSNRKALCDVMTCTPSAVSAFCAKLDTSSSSRIKIRGAISICETTEPSRAKLCANSQPIGPPPRTTKRLGMTSSLAKASHSVSLVT